MTQSSGPVDGQLSAGRPRVWLLDVTTPWFDELADRGLTSGAEKERAARIADPALARRMLARRSALRLVLSGHLGCQPDDVEIVTAPGGKPVLVPGDRSPSRRTLAFSVAHSGDYYGVAVAPVASLGLDLEHVRDVPRARAIAERWFNPAEARRLEPLDNDALQSEFMCLWTCKEALAKRHGAGLRLMSGDDVELDVEPATTAGLLRRFAPIAGYVCALASTSVISDIDVILPDSDPWSSPARD